MNLKEKFEDLNKKLIELSSEYHKQMAKINEEKEFIMLTVVENAGYHNASEYDFELTGWECENSPIGECIGNTDTQENECIFCGGPEERK
jgi:hypothetical protein